MLKKFLTVAVLGAASAAQAQNISHPLHYGPHNIGTPPTATTSNWYKDYVGTRVLVTNPASISGSYTFTTSNDGTTATGNWGGLITTPLVNVPIFMDSTADSFGCTGFSAADAASVTSVTPHKIFVIWRGPIVGACDFGCKALHAQQAGASAVVLINEYPGQPPVGMGASTTCTGITIPVFMVSNQDGINISGQYRSGIPVTMTLTTWGSGATNDLGFIPDGAAFWHDFAIPYNQISSNVAYNQLDGAFIGNFGAVGSNIGDITMSAYLNFTPTGGSPSLVHGDSVLFNAATGLLHYNSSVIHTTAQGATYPFNQADSVLAMYMASEYSIPTPSGTGRYDLTYNVNSADLADGNPADNTLTYSFYATDSLYSKGRYDFVNNKPVVGLSEQFNAGSEFVWGPMYFVGPHGGSAIEKIQYTLAQNSTATPPTTVFLTDDLEGNLVFVYKWVDNFNGTADSLLEDGELQLVSASLYQFNGTTDTSDALLELKRSNSILGSNFIGDANGDAANVLLDANSWYYVGVDVPAATFLGVDDQLNPFPRIYGRAHQSNIIDYSSVLSLDTTFSSTPNQIEAPVPSNESPTVIDVDSMQLHSIKGVIPAVALVTNRTPDSVHVPNGVHNVKKSSIDMSVYPNPATDYINVAVNLQSPAKTVTYEIVDGLGRFVSKVSHYNVQNEVYNIPTNNLAPGHYHIAVVANGQVQVRPFIIIK